MALALGIVCVALLGAVLLVVGSIINRTQSAADPAPASSTAPPGRTRPPAPPSQPTPTRAPDPTPRPTRAPEPAPVPKPTREPAWQVPDVRLERLPAPNGKGEAWRTVQRAELYQAAAPALKGCPGPGFIETMPQLRKWTAAQLACMQRAWRPVLRKYGLPAHEIKHHYYQGGTGTTPCGTMIAPAIYCSADGGSIYFGSALLRGTTHDIYWGKDLVNHEYGHHLQATFGMFRVTDSLPAGNETLRRAEIQATCFAMASLRHDDSVALDQEFYEGLEPHLRSFLDDGIHGSKDSLAYWGMRGFHSRTLADCNTWTASSAKVR